MRLFLVGVALALLWPARPIAQESPKCRMLCAPEFSIEPTLSVSNLFRSPRVVRADGVSARDPRTTDFELVLSFGIPTALSWLEFGLEAIVAPFDDNSMPELEFETVFTWLPSERTNGWLSSHFDVVDQFSPAERPSERRAYTHKLNLELDSSVSVFNWLPQGRYLRGVQLEGSLDYVATGLPRTGDVIGKTRYLDRASPWSFSLVFVVPVAPL